MRKISIKREQSQAGLSFAEREKFRPQVKNKLLLLLALLMTAATGAWAQDAKHLITATYREQTRSLEQPLPYATTVGELYEAVTGQSFSNLLSTMSLVEKPLTGISSNNTSVVSVGELNGASTPVTVNADGKATVGLNFSGYVQGIFVSAISPLYAYMKDGVKDADKWTAKVGEGDAQALPIGGLKGDGSETVTLQYNGRLKVKGVKATSEAAPAATLQSITVGKGSTDLSSDKKLYYMPGDTYRQALARTENQTAGELGWGFWESSDLTTIYFKEVSTKAWDMAIDGDSNFASGQGSSTITLDSVIDTTNHTFQFVNSQ